MTGRTPAAVKRLQELPYISWSLALHVWRSRRTTYTLLVHSDKQTHTFSPEASCQKLVAALLHLKARYNHNNLFSGEVQWSSHFTPDLPCSSPTISSPYVPSLTCPLPSQTPQLFLPLRTFYISNETSIAPFGVPSNARELQVGLSYTNDKR